MKLLKLQIKVSLSTLVLFQYLQAQVFALDIPSHQPRLLHFSSIINLRKFVKYSWHHQPAKKALYISRGVSNFIEQNMRFGLVLDWVAVVKILDWAVKYDSSLESS